MSNLNLVWEQDDKFGGCVCCLHSKDVHHTVVKTVAHFIKDEKKGSSIVDCYSDGANVCWNIHTAINDEGVIMRSDLCLGYIDKLHLPHPSYLLNPGVIPDQGGAVCMICGKAIKSGSWYAPLCRSCFHAEGL
jgi:hypothetical protein